MKQMMCVSIGTQENEEEVHKMMLALTIIHVVISVILVVAVLMQHGKQQGLSGAIAGGAETFFGKNKGKTIDAILKKVTAVVAILFVASSLTLAAVSINEYNKTNPGVEEGTEANLSMDESGNIVDAEGNIIMTAEDFAAQQAEAETQAEAESENAGEEQSAE